MVELTKIFVVEKTLRWDENCKTEKITLDIGQIESVEDFEVVTLKGDKTIVTKIIVHGKAFPVYVKEPLWEVLQKLL